MFNGVGSFRYTMVGNSWVKIIHDYIGQNNSKEKLVLSAHDPCLEIVFIHDEHVTYDHSGELYIRNSWIISKRISDNIYTLKSENKHANCSGCLENRNNKVLIYLTFKPMYKLKCNK